MTYPRCTQCRRMFTPRALLENGRCHECNDAAPMYVSMMIWGLVIAGAIVLCTLAGCAGYADGEDIMQKYRAGNFRLAASYYTFEQFKQETDNAGAGN